MMKDKIYFIADKNKKEALLPLKPFFTLESAKNTIKRWEKSRDIRKKSGLSYIDREYEVWEWKLGTDAHG
jgi:hypothetical protein